MSSMFHPTILYIYICASSSYVWTLRLVRCCICWNSRSRMVPTGRWMYPLRKASNVDWVAQNLPISFHQPTQDIKRFAGRMSVIVSMLRTRHAADDEHGLSVAVRSARNPDRSKLAKAMRKPRVKHGGIMMSNVKSSLINPLPTW